jgi:hypothetical protein
VKNLRNSRKINHLQTTFRFQALAPPEGRLSRRSRNCEGGPQSSLVLNIKDLPSRTRGAGLPYQRQRFSRSPGKKQVQIRKRRMSVAQTGVKYKYAGFASGEFSVTVRII